MIGLRGALLAIVCAAGAGAPASAGELSAALRPAVYAVDLNGARVSDGALLLTAPNGDLFARADDLRAWRINVPAGLPAVVRDTVRYVALRAIPGIAASVDAPTQTLRLRAGPTALRATVVPLGERTPLDVARPAGAYANYAFAQSGGSYGSTLAGELQGGAAALGGVVQTDLLWTPGALTRASTAWTHDDARRMQAVAVGDTTTTDVKLGSALRFAGVRWSSDFDEQPQFSTYPGVTIRGAASIPSALDIEVNDALALRRDVPAGTYTLRDLPVLDGAGTVAIRAVDALGGITRIQIPYYAARQLLAPGLTAFSYGAGFLDEAGTYGPFVADASRRWGRSDSLTLGAMAQFGAGDAIAGASADWLAGRAGVLSLALAGSRAARAAGLLFDAGYDYQARRFAVGGELRVASAGFTALDPTALPIGRELDLHASLRLTRATSAQVSAARDQTVSGPVTVWSAGIAGSSAGIPYSVTAYKTAGAGANAFGVTGTWSIPVGRRATLAPQIGSGANGAQSRLEFSGSAGGDPGGIGWDVGAGLTRQAPSTLRLSAANGSGEFDLDATSAAGLSAYTARVQGGFALLGGAIAATREIGGSYALVRVPGYAGIDVYVNGRYAGKTDARGNLITAELVPFVENEIRLDPARLPAGVQFAALTRTVVPTAFGGTTISFRARPLSEARLTLRDGHGRPLAPGTLLRGVPAGTDAPTWPVGLEGHIDLIGVAPGPLELRAADGGPACTIRLVIPAGGALVFLPDARCS